MSQTFDLQVVRFNDSRTHQLKLVDGQSERQDLRVSFQDRHAFDVQLRFRVGEHARRDTQDTIEAYFFVPRELGLTPATYTRQHFYRDLESHLLVEPARDEADDGSRDLVERLRALQRQLDELQRTGGDAAAIQEASFRVRFLGAEAISQLQSAGDRCLLWRSSATTADMERSVNEFAAACRERTAALRRRAMLPAGSLPLLRQTFEWTDEYMSISVSQLCAKLVTRLDERPEAAQLVQARQVLLGLDSAEQRYRESSRYPIATASDEHFTYRVGVLANFTQSALALDYVRDEDGKTAVEFVSAVAAGAAMAASLGVAAVSERIYGLNTTPFALALVAGYILKDRTKDWVRRLFARRVGRWLADFRGVMWGPTRQALGRFREAFVFMAPAAVPREILSRRHRDSPSPIEVASKPEVVFRYEKAFRLRPKEIVGVYGPVTHVSNHLRFNVVELMQRMRSPSSRVRSIVGGGVERRELPKVYHLNLVFALRSQGEEPALARVRIVLDREGIRRVELA